MENGKKTIVWYDLDDYMTVYVSRSVNQTPTAVSLPRLLSQEQFIIYQYAQGLLLAMASFFGMATNVVNMYIFRCMDLRDSVTVSFLGLAVADFTVSFFNFCGSISMAVFAQDLHQPLPIVVDPFMLSCHAGYVAYVCYYVTVLLTMCIAIVRCMCVLQPLKFKQTFTAQRCKRFNYGCWIFAGAYYFGISAIGTTTVGTVFHPYTNSSRLNMAYTSARTKVRDFVFLFGHGAMVPATQVVLSVCIVAMVHAMRKSREIRHGGTGDVANQANDNDGDDINQVSDRGSKHTITTVQRRGGKDDGSSGQAAAKNTASSRSSEFSNKERRVIQQVVLLCVLYLVCNVPGTFVSVATALVPEVDADPDVDRYARFYFSITATRKFFEQLNSASNIFIYLKYNRKFSELCQKQLGGCQAS